MGGFAASRILEVHGERMIKRTFDPGFRIELHQKDLNLALHGARALGVALPQTADAAQLMQACAANGMAELDHSALVRALELMAAARGGAGLIAGRQQCRRRRRCRYEDRRISRLAGDQLPLPRPLKPDGEAQQLHSLREQVALRMAAADLQQARQACPSVVAPPLRSRRGHAPAGRGWPARTRAAMQPSRCRRRCGRMPLDVAPSAESASGRPARARP